MREMKDSGIEWIGEIPADWSVARLKYILSEPMKYGATESGIDFEETLPRYIRITDISTDGKLKEEGKLSLSEQQAKGYILKDNTVLFARSGGTVGKSFIYHESYGRAAFAGYLISANVNEKISSAKWLKYYTESQGYWEWVNIVFSQATIQNIGADKYSNMPLTIAPLHEQHRIVSYLDRKCSEIDELVADIENQIETLEQYKRSVITEAVTKGLKPDVEMKESGYSWLGSIPADWMLRRGKYLFEQRNQRGNTKELQLLSPTQKFGVIPQSLYEELTGMSAVKLNDNANLSLLKTIHKGDFCISLRSFQGGFEYSEYEGVVSPAYQVFYPIVSIADGYYKYLFKDIGFIEKMNSYTMTLRDGKNIAFADFGSTYIPYPPVAEQQAIADYLDCKCAEIESIIADKQRQLDTLAEYKKSVIYEYVTGKKEVEVDES